MLPFPMMPAGWLLNPLLEVYSRTETIVSAKRAFCEPKLSPCDVGLSRSDPLLYTSTWGSSIQGAFNIFNIYSTYRIMAPYGWMKSALVHYVEPSAKSGVGDLRSNPHFLY